MKRKKVPRSKKKSVSAMEWLTYSLMGITLVILGYVIYFSWQSHNNPKYALILPKEYQQQRCSRWLSDFKDTSPNEDVSLIREYYHCIFSLQNHNSCYGKFYAEMTSCLKEAKVTMSDDEINYRITGGIMVEACSNIESACAPSDSQALNKEASTSVKNFCQQLIRQECNQMGYNSF